MAHTLGAAGSATVDETLACTASPPAAYEAPRTTFVPHARATETTTAYCLASASGVAHREVTIATCAAGSPHPIAFSTSDPATRRHLGANALYRDSAGSALARSMTVARDFTAARGASKNTAPQGDSGSGAAARTFATRCSGTPGSASAASRSAAAAVASAASSAGVGIVLLRSCSGDPGRRRGQGMTRESSAATAVSDRVWPSRRNQTL
jgi:hypothetical protein